MKGTGSGLTARIAAFLFFVQVLGIGGIYFLRLDNRVLEIPFVKHIADSLRKNRNIAEVWTRFEAQQTVWGYVDRHSILPGERINLMLSTRPGDPDVPATVTISRIAGKDGKERRIEFWRGDEIIVKTQEQFNSLTSVGASWSPSYAIPDTKDWETGFYVVDLKTADGKIQHNLASFVVKTADRTGDILIKMSSNTWQAYNRWGGASLYNSALFGSRDVVVSFDRPTYPGGFDYETYFVSWADEYADSKGLKVGYISDFDLHDDPAILDGYKILVSHGHDEYWTKEMFDAVENRIFKQGKNVLFYGANTAYWQIRYADINQAPGARSRGRQMISYKESDDPILDRFETEKEAMPWITQQFRWKSRRPETMLMGVAYQNYFNPGDSGPFYDLEIVSTALPFFEGTDLKAGDKFKGLLGYEWDNRDPEGDGKRLWSATESMNAELPKDRLNVLFNGKTVDVNGKPGLAEAVYWESPAGAKVFSSGSIRWDWGFGKPGYSDDRFKRFNANLIGHMLQ